MLACKTVFSAKVKHKDMADGIRANARVEEVASYNKQVIFDFCSGRNGKWIV